MSGASVEYSQPRPCSGAKTLRRRRSRVDADNVVLIDVDSDGFDNVILIDTPDSLRNKFRSSRVLRKDRKGSWATVICLDDDETSESNNAHNDVEVDGDLNNGASTSTSSHCVSGSVGSSSNGVSGDCEFIRENIAPVKLSKGKRTYSRIGTSDGDYIDCELMEDSLRVRELWERASWKRKCDTRNGQSDGRHPEMVFSGGHRNINVDNNHKQREENHFVGNDSENGETWAHSVPKENADPILENRHPHDEASDMHWREFLNEEPLYDNNHHLGSHQIEEEDLSSSSEEVAKNNPPNSNEEPLELVSNNGLDYEKDDSLHDQDDLKDSILGEREKLKETDEYKRALEEELASRKQALRAQAEEAQNLRRLMKRERNESVRLLDMERRQKQRIEEIRESQKKDVEDMNLKEVFRASVRQELYQLETSCHSMASLLQQLGVLGDVGSHPSSDEVRLAYKRAVLTFHPDRASRSDIRQQVEAEEKFKLISRMKEKFLLT